MLTNASAQSIRTTSESRFVCSEIRFVEFVMSNAASLDPTVCQNGGIIGFEVD